MEFRILLLKAGRSGYSGARQLVYVTGDKNSTKNPRCSLDILQLVCIPVSVLA